MLQNHPSNNSKIFSLLAAPTRRPVVKPNKAKTRATTMQKVPFPRLVSGNRLELQREFSPYTALANWYYESTAKIAAYLRAHLNSADTIANTSWRGREYAISANRKRPDLDYQAVLVQYTRTAVSAGKYLRIGQDFVTVTLTPLEFNVAVINNPDGYADFLRMMRKIFGSDFKMPTEYHTTDTGISADNSDSITTGGKNVDFFKKLNFTVDAAPGTYQPKDIDIDPVEGDSGDDDDDDDSNNNKINSKPLRRRVRTQIANVKDALRVEVKIKSMQAFRNGSSITTGDLDNAMLVYTFKVTGLCKFPMEYALWATHAKNMDEFVPKLFREHFDRTGAMQVLPGGGTYKANLHARTMHFGNIKQLNNDRIKEYGIEVKPRVNTENFCITYQGRVIYVPNEDNTDFYVKTLKESYNTESNQIKFNSDIPEIHNKIIMVDWINDILAYTDDSGKPATQSLRGAIPLDNVTIYSTLNINLQIQSAEWKDAIARFGDSICSEFKLYDTVPHDEVMNNRLFSSMIFNLGILLGSGTESFNYAQAYAIANDPSNDELTPTTKKYVIYFADLCKAIAANMMQSNRIALSTKITYMFYYYAFGNYIRQLPVFRKAYGDALAKNSNPTPEEMKTQFNIPNVPGITKLLPHQQEAGTISSRDNPPDNLILEVSAGGGKTLQLFIDVLLQKQKGKIKTAMIICPGRLVKEYCSEVNKMSRGEVNVVPITTQVIQKMRDHLGFDKMAFMNYLKSAPINTLFVCSINFLGLAKDHFSNENTGSIMQYGESFIQFFPNVQILRQLNIDYIACDECFTGDTRVLVDYDKAMKIEDIYNDPSVTHVLSYDLQSRKIIKKKILKKIRYDVKEKDQWSSIYVKHKGKIAKLNPTSNHMIFKSDKSEIAASKLSNKDKLITYDGKFKNYKNCPHCNELIEDIGHKYYHHMLKYHNEHTTTGKKCPICNVIMKNGALKRHMEFKHTGLSKESKIAYDKLNSEKLKYQASEAGKHWANRNSKRMKLNNPMKDLSVRKKAGLGVSKTFWAKSKEEREIIVKRFMNAPIHRFLPNKIEKKVIEQNITGLKFVGDAKYFVKLKIDGKHKSKNPDFIYVPEKCGTCKSFEKCNTRKNSNICKNYNVASTYRTNKVVEIMDMEYWHSPEEAEVIKTAYSDKGISCMIIDAKDVKNDIKYVRGKIESFINNHYIDIVKVTKPFSTSIANKHKYKYDLTVEGNHNYFAIAEGINKKDNINIPILVHNSHYISNPDARRTKAYLALSPTANVRRIASGTINPDNAANMVSQYATLNPHILGTKDQFVEKYGIATGNGKFAELKPGMGKELSLVRKPYTARVKKVRADWGFLLPRIDIELTRCFMTENQQNYYDFMISDKMKELREDPKIQKMLAEADESQSKKIERALDAKLWVVEEFINAPDSNNTFQKWADGYNVSDMDDDLTDVSEVTAAPLRPRTQLTKEDFVSCKVKKIDDILNNFFNVEKSKNKVIIFGINKVVSRHIFRHTRFRNRAVHYAVKDSLSGVSANEAILKFRNDPNTTLLIADATSMREGLNLQIAAMVIYVQTEWSPGPQEQAVSRALRPDVGDIYQRDSVVITKLYATNSMEVAKVAKLINKEVVTKEVDNVDDPDWQKFIVVNPTPPITPIKMSFEMIEHVRSLDHPDVAATVECYRRINKWEHLQFGVVEDRLKTYTAKRLDIPYSQVNLKKDALLNVDGNSKMPNSKYIFTPLEDGTTPIDRRNLNLIPVAITSKPDQEDDEENENDDDENEMEDYVDLSAGDLVQTEYGFGYVVSIQKRQVRVRIPGMPNNPYALSKLSVFKPQSPGNYHPTLSADQWQANVKKLEKDMAKAGAKGITFMNGQDIGTNTNAPIEVLPVKTPPKADHPAVKPEQKITPVSVQPDENDEPTPTSKRDKETKLPKDNKAKLDLIPLVLNGVATLAAYTDEPGYAKLQENYGVWKKVPPFLTIRVHTPNGAANLAKAITNAGLTVAPGPLDPRTKKRQPDQIAKMQLLAKAIRGGSSGGLQKQTNGSYSSILKNPLLITHNPPADDVTLKIYTVIWNDHVYMMAPIAIQSKQIAKLRKVRASGCDDGWTVIKNFAITQFPGPNRLKKVIQQIGASEKVGNYEEALEIVEDSLFKKVIGI